MTPRRSSRRRGGVGLPGRSCKRCKKAPQKGRGLKVSCGDQTTIASSAFPGTGTRPSFLDAPSFVRHPTDGVGPKLEPSFADTVSQVDDRHGLFSFVQKISRFLSSGKRPTPKLTEQTLEVGRVRLVSVEQVPHEALGSARHTGRQHENPIASFRRYPALFRRHICWRRSSSLTRRPRYGQQRSVQPTTCGSERKYSIWQH